LRAGGSLAPGRCWSPSARGSFPFPRQDGRRALLHTRRLPSRSPFRRDPLRARLPNTSDPQTIADWIGNEDAWLSTQPKLLLLLDYRNAVESSFLTLKTGASPDQVTQMALDIIKAARDVPGVDLK
jgi:hypothetical protein